MWRFTCASGKWKFVNVTLESSCWLYQTGIKTSDKRYSKGDIVDAVFLLIHTFGAHSCCSRSMSFSVKVEDVTLPELELKG